MSYLFFDTECAKDHGSGGNICEFGYVLCDDDFNIIEKDNLVINPLLDNWDSYVVENILTYEKSYYLSKPSFPYYYNKIKDLIENATYVIGHTLNSDVPRLNKDCSKYGLPYINFKFYDVVEMYEEYTGTSDATSLVNMLINEEIESDLEAHNAMNDAFNTMLIYIKMVKTLNINLEEFLDLALDCEYVTYGGQFQNIFKFDEVRFISCLDGSSNRKVKCFYKYIMNMYNDKLSNRNIKKNNIYYIDSYFIKENFILTVNLYTFLYKHHIYISNSLKKANLCLVYNKEGLSEEDKEKYNKHLETISKRYNIVSIDYLLSKYNLTVSDLEDKLLFDKKTLIRNLKDYIEKSNINLEGYNDDNESQVSFGDLLKERFND